MKRNNRVRQNMRRQLAGVLIVSNLITLGGPAFTGLAAETQASVKPNTVDSIMNLYQAANDDQKDTEGDEAETGDAGLVSVDESLYVNLDYYGKPTKASVVKGFSSSKAMDYTDYGDYQSVLNMSTEQKLQTAPGKVSFQLDGTGKKFFIEGTVDPNALQLPWNTTVSYKLNGVPVEAEKLKGASGTVEIDIKADANDQASEYMRNNMVLAAVVPVDDKKIYSVDAPGSQTQTIGEMTGVVFTALPGESKEFTARLGTESYESIGVVLMMIPATIDDLDTVTDIKNLKDTWRSSGDAMYEGMDNILGIVEAMRGEMNGLKKSLGLADSVRGTLHDSKDSIFNTNDRALSDLNAMGVELQKLIPFIASSQNQIWQLNSDVNDLVGMLDGMQSSLSYMSRGLDKLSDGSFDTESDLGSVSSDLKKLLIEAKKLTASASTAAGYDKEAFQKKIDKIIGIIDGILAQMGGQQTAFDRSALADGADWYEMSDETADLLNEIGDSSAVSEADAVAGNDPVTDQAQRFAKAYGISADQVSADDLEVMGETLDSLTGASGLASVLYERLMQLKTQLEALRSVPDGIDEVNAKLDEVAKSADSLSGSSQDMLAGAGRTSTGAKLVTEDLRDTITKVQQLNDTVNTMYPTIQSTLTQTQAVLRQSGTALNSSTNAMWLLQNTLRSVSDTADASMQQAIQSSISMIDKTLDIIDATGKVRAAGSEAKQTLDNELDKYDGENNVLKMDPHAKKPSFTSAENKEPASLQIILRTDEIEEPDDNTIVDGETAAQNVSIFQRIKNVFLAIINAIKEAFANN